jgi:light-regulated signal transduction histidine kinase (bacteriophytochrome)
MLEEDFSHQLPEEAADILSTIQENTLRMMALIDGLLEFSKSGKKPLEKEQLDLEKIARDAFRHIQQASLSSARFTLHPLPPANGDYVLLLQVFTNLIGNAVKYSSKKEKPEIEVGSIPSSAEHIYYVKDNGAGFNMAYADKLFGVFQRLHGEQEFEGTGIGLSLTHRIITRHGGRIWAEGKENEGAVFYFSLPL